MAVFPFLAEEEEEFLLFFIPLFRNENWPPDGVTKIVKTKRIHSLGKKRPCIKAIVADKLKERSVKVAATAFGYNIHQRTGAAAKLSAIAGSEDLHFSNSVRAGVYGGV